MSDASPAGLGQNVPELDLVTGCPWPPVSEYLDFRSLLNFVRADMGTSASSQESFELIHGD